MEGVLVIKNVSVKLFSFFNGRSIDDQERVVSFINGGGIGEEELFKLLQWREYW